MTCRRCKNRYDARAQRVCPHCGEPRRRPRPVFLKTSTILVSTSETEAVYRSLEEVPARLRAVLLESTNGRNSATILIADRKGREEIARAARHIPDGGETGRKAPGGLAAPVYAPPRRVLRIAAALLVLMLVALVLWVVCGRPPA